MNQYTEQLSHINQKEEELSKAKIEISRLQNLLSVAENDLQRYRQGDGARSRVEQITNEEVVRLRAELATEKTRRKLVEKKAEEDALELKDAERNSNKELREAEHALHMKLVEAEKNVEFFRAQSIIHENNEKRLQQDIALLQAGVANEVQDLKNRNLELQEENEKWETEIASQLKDRAVVDKRMMQLHVFEHRCKELEKLIEDKDRQLSTQALRLIKMDELGITSIPQQESEVERGPVEEQEERQEQ